jgi:hypothetical protein
LSKALSHPAERVRVAAARATGRLYGVETVDGQVVGVPDVEAMTVHESLAEATADPSENVRIAAYESIARLVKARPELGSRYRDVLERGVIASEAAIQESALKTLTHTGTEAQVDVDPELICDALVSSTSVRDNAVQCLAVSLSQSNSSHSAARHSAELACWALLAENQPIDGPEEITADVLTAAGDASIVTGAGTSVLDACEQMYFDSLDDDERRVVAALVAHIGTNEDTHRHRAADLLRGMLSERQVPKSTLRGLRRIQRASESQEYSPSEAALELLSEPEDEEYWPFATDVVCEAMYVWNDGSTNGLAIEAIRDTIERLCEFLTARVDTGDDVSPSEEAIVNALTDLCQACPRASRTVVSQLVYQLYSERVSRSGLAVALKAGTRSGAISLSTTQQSALVQIVADTSRSDAVRGHTAGTLLYSVS